jgi:HSP20 family molecular chaperone IbpA
MNEKLIENKGEGWKLAKQFLGGSFPFSDMNKLSTLMDDPGWLDRLIEDTIEQAVPQEMKQSSNKTRASADKSQRAYINTQDIMETHRSLIIQMKLPSKTDPYRIRLYVAPLSVRIEGLPGDEKRKIELPREIELIGIRSSYKDHTLEIRLPKRRTNQKERQISIDIE